MDNIKGLAIEQILSVPSNTSSVWSELRPPFLKYGSMKHPHASMDVVYLRFSPKFKFRMISVWNRESFLKSKTVWKLLIGLQSICLQIKYDKFGRRSNRYAFFYIITKKRKLVHCRTKPLPVSKIIKIAFLCKIIDWLFHCSIFFLWYFSFQTEWSLDFFFFLQKLIVAEENSSIVKMLVMFIQSFTISVCIIN